MTINYMIFPALLFLMSGCSENSKNESLQSRISYLESKISELENEIDVIKSKAEEARYDVKEAKNAADFAIDRAQDCSRRLEVIEVFGR